MILDIVQAPFMRLPGTLLHPLLRPSKKNDTSHLFLSSANEKLNILHANN